MVPREARLQPSDRLVLQAICASPAGALFGVKKLQKLLFIAHHPQLFGLRSRRPLRAFRFKVYNYGPFAEDVYGSLERLHSSGLIDIETRDVKRSAVNVAPDSTDEDSPAHTMRVYRASADASEELVGADEVDLRLVAAAVNRWGWLTSDQIEELVLIRTGLTPALKSRYAGLEWSAFEKKAASELPQARPEPPEAYWRAQQQFFKERAALLKAHGGGRYAAYVGLERVAIAEDEVAIYKRVVEERGRPPDFIGFLSETGRESSQALSEARAT